MRLAKAVAALVAAMLLAPAGLLAAPGAGPLDGALPVVTGAISVADALRIAAQCSPALAEARATRAGRDAVAEGALAAERPSAAATAYASAGSMSSVVSSAPGVAPANILAVPRGPFSDADVMAMAPLFTGGKLADRLRAARGAADAASADESAAVLAVQMHVQDAYVAILEQQALLASDQSAVDAQAEEVRVAQAELNTGRIAPVDMLREQAALAAGQAQVAAAQSAVGAALSKLLGAMGVSQLSQITLTDTLAALSAQPDSVDGLSLPDALRAGDADRPEITAARRRADATAAALAAARAAYAPQIYGVVMGDVSGGRAGGNAGYTLGLAASIPLRDGGARRADIDAAIARQSGAVAEQRAAEADVESQIAQAWYALRAARLEVGAARAAVTAADTAYTLATMRTNAGKGTTADRLGALAARTAAQSALAQAEAASVIAAADLRAGIGRELTS